ncbi:hypothetical protein WR164_03640 [Philodulcilactobacillus myokoensis]|uniref:Uncharacterized protein n=1 Tax=Philodulcilactobacillus myokoensis TaxID=2929573 RepID=A0A9W6ES15_9LACO|nr:hypothetical protein [Philodulcilactobacillus myokoensis]GLB46385.1 hypothetical protein WR164_03640 [Philodulcilactobacillus myokoensis]
MPEQQEEHQTNIKIAIKIQHNLFEKAYQAAQSKDQLTSEVLMTLRAYLNMGLNSKAYQTPDKDQLKTNLKAACHVAFSNEYENGNDTPEYAQQLSRKASQIIDDAYQNDIAPLFNN